MLHPQRIRLESLHTKPAVFAALAHVSVAAKTRTTTPPSLCSGHVCTGREREPAAERAAGPPQAPAAGGSRAAESPSGCISKAEVPHRSARSAGPPEGWYRVPAGASSTTARADAIADSKAGCTDSTPTPKCSQDPVRSTWSQCCINSRRSSCFTYHTTDESPSMLYTAMFRIDISHDTSADSTCHASFWS